MVKDGLCRLRSNNDVGTNANHHLLPVSGTTSKTPQVAPEAVARPTKDGSAIYVNALMDTWYGVGKY